MCLSCKSWILYSPEYSDPMTYFKEMNNAIALIYIYEVSFSK